MPPADLPVHKRIFRILVSAGKEFGEDRASRLAAALSFYTLFSIVPLLFLVVAIVGYVSEDSVLTQNSCATVGVAIIPENPDNPLDRMMLQVDEVAGRQVADQLAELTCEANVTAPGALWIGIALAAFSGSSVFLHVQGVLNYLFHAPQDRVRGLTATLVKRGIALASAIVLAVLVLIPLVAVATVNIVRDLVAVQWIRNLVGIGVPLTSLVLMVVIVTLTFRLLPQADIDWKASRRGGIFTALTGLAAAFGVGLYLGRFGAAGTLGALGGAAILLFFFNLMWMVYLFGAEVTKVYADYLAFGDVKAPSERLERSSFDAPGAEAAPGRDRRPPPPEWRSGIVAFLIGVATGWAARRRDS